MSMNGACMFRWTTAWHETRTCMASGHVQPGGGFRCEKHDRHEIRENVLVVPAAWIGHAVHVVEPADGRLSMNWRLHAVEGDTATIVRLSPGARRGDRRALPVTALRLPCAAHRTPTAPRNTP